MILEFMQRTQSSEDPDPIVISFKEITANTSGSPKFGIESVAKGYMFETILGVERVKRSQVPALVSSSKDFPVLLHSWDFFM